MEKDIKGYTEYTRKFFTQDQCPPSYTNMMDWTPQDLKKCLAVYKGKERHTRENQKCCFLFMQQYEPTVFHKGKFLKKGPGYNDWDKT